MLPENGFCERRHDIQNNVRSPQCEILFQTKQTVAECPLAFYEAIIEIKQAQKQKSYPSWKNFILISTQSFTIFPHLSSR